MDSFGAYLKGHRESKGIRLEEIASITKIHLHNLELLEADQWEKLPPDPFLRGFIVAYGKYVGLEPKELLGRYLEVMNVAPVAASPTSADSSDTAPPPGELIDQGPALSTKKIFGTAGIALIVALLGGIVYLGKRATDQSLKQTSAKTEETAPATQAAAEKAPASVPAAPAADSKTTAAATAAKTTASNHTAGAQAPAAAPAAAISHKVNIEGSERTWIKVVVDENAPIEYFLPQGEKVSYQAKDKIKVVLGNATGAKVFYNGKATEGVNFLGTIRSYKFPENAEFPQDTASRRVPTSDTPSQN